MMLAARGAIRASGAGLPYDAEVEYLESSGTQWIDTGVKGSDDLSFKVTYRRNAFNSGRVIFGVGESSVLNYQQALMLANSGSNIYYIRRGNAAIRVSIPYDTDWHTFYLSKTECSIDDVRATGAMSATATTNTLKLFATSTSTTTTITGGFIAGCQVWEASTLVRDYIPVRRGTVGYMYDRVTRRLFGNAGSGAFSYGSDVVPVAYIESHGTEWIDTGVGLSPDIGLRIDFQFADVTREQILFGALEAGVARFHPVWRGLSELYWSNAINGSLGGSYGETDSNRHIITNNYLNDKEATIDGVVKGTNIVTVEGTSLVTNYLFARHYNNAGYICSAKVFQCQVSAGTNVVRDFLPVRVGTEGAMMDTLTRRIYRNAGTGAFTFGNDLRYPIPA